MGIDAFMDKWKRFEQNELCCFYKYWCLNLKYAHWDAMAVLDMFTRYDIVYNKCKKLLKSKQKSEENKEATEEDADLNEKVRNIQILLNTVCRIILEGQIPTLWNENIQNFNRQMEK